MSLYLKFIVHFVLTSLLGTSFYSFFGSLYETISITEAVSFWVKSLIFTVIVCTSAVLLLLPVLSKVTAEKIPSVNSKKRPSDTRSVLTLFTAIMHLILYPLFAVIAEIIGISDNDSGLRLPILTVLACLSGILMFYTNLYHISKICRSHNASEPQNPKKANTSRSSLKWLHRFVLGGTLLIWATPLSAVAFFVPLRDVSELSNGYLYYMGLAAFGTLAALALTCIPVLTLCMDIRRQTGKLSKWVLERKTTRNFTPRLSFCFTTDMIEIEDKINNFMNRLQNSLAFLKKESLLIIEEKEQLTRRGKSAVETSNTISESLNQIRESSLSQKEVIDLTENEVNSLVSGATDMIRQVSHQNQSIQQSSASVSEISSAVASIAEMARQANIISTMLKESSESGRQTLIRTNDTIKAIQTSSLDIQQILHSIQKIAKQTNLLSMNASIEAAHAGATGRGFAIVADEVRSLSSLSNRNAKEIETHIEMMIEKVNHGVEAITAAENAFNDIVNGIGENFELMNRIADSMTTQQKSTQSTLESTFAIVKSVERISSLAEKQNQYTQNAKKIMDEVVELADRIGTTIEKQQKELESVSDMARQAVINIETDRSTAADMLQSIQIFQNDSRQEKLQ